MSKIILKVGHDISTDVIYPGRFMATVLPTETPKLAFADMTEFNTRLNAGEFGKGGVILAGKNFGCGSSREQAASCLRGHDIICVAQSFARIFLQNAINLGLKTVVCPDIEAEEGHDLEIGESQVVNKTTGKSFAVIPHAPMRQAIIDAGGLIPYARKKLVAERAS